MSGHDIVDNRSDLLVDAINRMLDSSARARFAVGYLFVSGLEALGERLDHLQDLRLVIGNTTNRQTIEQLAEGYRHLDAVAEISESESFPNQVGRRRIEAATAANIGSTLQLMEQTDAGENTIRRLAAMIKERRLKVRVYTAGRLHAKAYIFDYAPIFDAAGGAVERHEKGIAVVGSSNLSLAGIRHSTELNVVVQGNENHEQLGRWFESIWDEAQDFDAALMTELASSWALAHVTPYDIYMKTLYRLVRDRLVDGHGQDVLWDDEITDRLAEFQKVAVRQAIQIIRDVGGVFVADVVGLGKSYVGAAIVKHFEYTDRARPLIICPAALVEMWERYNEVYALNARVLSMGYLREGAEKDATFLMTDIRFRDRDFVLIDESHNFRHSETQRYHVLQAFLATGRRACLLTATPRNKSAWDVFNQLKLFHPDDKTDLPIDPPDLRDYFRLIDKGDRGLPDLLRHVQIRRLRNHVLRWYGYDAETHLPVDPSDFRPYLEGRRRAYVIVGGHHNFFPKRELQTIEYSLEATYQGLYEQIRQHLGGSTPPTLAAPLTGELSYARYGLWRYVRSEMKRREPYVSLQQAGPNLRGLIRVLLFKRLESSVFAFRETIRRLILAHERFLTALAEGVVAAGEEAQTLLYESDRIEEDDLLSALRAASARYSIEDFNGQLLATHVAHDLDVLRSILDLIEPITPERDAKLQTLLKRLDEPPLKDGKRLIFTQYADTARYLYENLNPTGALHDIDVIYSGDKSKARVVGRFAPYANPEFAFGPGDTELMTLVATDVLAEGLNLQDCGKIVNYDLHWNPVRLIQRFGRIDRIGSGFDVIYGFNFLPELGLDRNLNLRQRLRERIREIHETIGEDAAILDSSELLNEEAMYAIYEGRGDQLDLFESTEDLVDLNEAEEMFRVLRRDNPEEYERILAIKDGVRSAKRAETSGTFVFCEAGRYQQLFLIDSEQGVVSRDVPKVLAAIKATPDTEAQTLRDAHNVVVTSVRQRFAQEVRQRRAERTHGLGLTQGQRYVLRELRALYNAEEDEDVKAQIDVLEPAFRGFTSAAVQRELGHLRRSTQTGHLLLQSLVRLFHQHDMAAVARDTSRIEQDETPIIVCSEGLL